MVRIHRIFGAKPDPRQRYTELVQPHIKLLYRMAYRWTQNREEAEDLVQDVLTKLVSRLDEMESVDQLRPWLVKILYRRFVDLYRRNRRSPIEHEHSWQADTRLLEERAADGSDDIERLEWQQVLLRGMETLDDDQRDAILLHDVEGYTALEIADMLEISVGTVKSRVHRARNKLKEFLGREPFDLPERVNRQQEKA